MKIWLFLLMLTPVFSWGQEGIPYLDFKLRNSGRSVEVEWQILPGNFCQDVEIWRGTDSSQLHQVFIYPGICGDDDSLKTYSYIDLPPVSGITYYYRIIVISDRTEIKSLVVYPNNKTELFPNPAQNRVWIIRDPGEQYERYSIYDLNGRQIISIDDPEISERLNLDGIPSGEYIVRYESRAGIVHERLKIL
jgi:hypothetical protein